MPASLQDISASLSTPVEQRLFAEYGAIFVTSATPPPQVIFADGAQVEDFQSSLESSRAVFGKHEIQLQVPALEALSRASAAIAVGGGSITARAADAGRRSYEDTVSLWTRNVTRGLSHWRELGRISSARSTSILEMNPREQVGVILALEEEEQIFFGTFFDRSILYSVAAPGASQHLSMLAFDVAEFEEPAVAQGLNRNGWYRTVPNDLPHFTYLGHDWEVLPALGLTLTSRSYGDRVYDFWIPDLSELRPS